MITPPDFSLEFVALAAFDHQARGLLDEEDLRRVEQRLIRNPAAGSVVPGAGGVRKLRVPARGKGARGGARVIYYLRSARGRVYLVAAYSKNVKEDLTPGEKRYFRRLTAILDAEG
jgi:hypothetical protein